MNVENQVFLTYLILNIDNKFEKIIFFSPYLHQDFYQTLIKCSSNFTPMNKNRDISQGGDIVLIKEKIFKDENFEKSEPERETIESVEKLKQPHEHNSDYPVVNTIEDLGEKGTMDPRVQTMFKRSTHSNISMFIFRQDYYELPNKLFAPTVTYIMYSNQIFSEMFKTCKKTMHL